MTEPHRLRIANSRERLARDIIREHTANEVAPRVGRLDAFLESLHEAGIEMGDRITLDVALLSRILFLIDNGR